MYKLFFLALTVLVCDTCLAAPGSADIFPIAEMNCQLRRVEGQMATYRGIKMTFGSSSQEAEAGVTLSGRWNNQDDKFYEATDKSPVRTFEWKTPMMGVLTRDLQKENRAKAMSKVIPLYAGPPDKFAWNFTEDSILLYGSIKTADGVPLNMSLEIKPNMSDLEKMGALYILRPPANNVKCPDWYVALGFCDEAIYEVQYLTSCKVKHSKAR